MKSIENVKTTKVNNLKQNKNEKVTRNKIIQTSEIKKLKTHTTLRKNNKQIEFFYLNGIKIDENESKDIKKIALVKQLNDPENNIKKFILSTYLGWFENLRYLDVRYNLAINDKIESQLITAILKGPFKKLSTLYMNAYPMTLNQVVVFSKSIKEGYFNELELLDLGGVMKNTHNIFFATLSSNSLPNLKELAFCCNAVSASGRDLILKWLEKNVSNLEKLDLRSNLLTDFDIIKIVKKIKEKKITVSLAFEGNNLKQIQKTKEKIANLVKNTNIKVTLD